jgi:hypothetical protein
MFPCSRWTATYGTATITMINDLTGLMFVLAGLSLVCVGLFLWEIHQEVEQDKKEREKTKKRKSKS